MQYRTLESLGEKECVLCNTDEEIIELFELLNSKGFKWCSGASYTNSKEFKTNKDTFYVKNGSHHSIDYAFAENYNIIPFSQTLKNSKIQDLFNI